MHKESGFPCSQCGECCRHIDLVPQLADLDLGNGICIHLKGNLCEIYWSRPEVCSVDLMYKKYFGSQYTRDEFYELNRAVCKNLQKKYRAFSKDKLSDSYL